MSEPQYQPLSPKKPAWGEIAVLAWDSEVFGFPVATYRATDPSAMSANLAGVSDALKNWALENEVELIGCSIPASERLGRFCLPRLGFLYVDSTLIYSLPKLQRTKFPRRYKLRPATLADQESVERIAEQSFEAGRYHADPLFPRELAQRRFRKWLTQAFASLNPTSRIFVLGEPGAVTAFSHSYVHGDEAHITIGGVDAAFHRRGLGPAIFVGTFAALQDLGARRAHSKVSVGNAGAMNCAAFGGARFSDPEHVYHWHAPDARHLLDARSLRGLK
jgi:ribosomal protein S18 acetylase RimI-like enzyme